jgi:Undecaprenyl-phosphate galactose phosphotransferase WbaP
MTQEVKYSLKHWINAFVGHLPRSITRIRMGLILLITDVLALLISGILALIIWSFVRSDINYKNYIDIIGIVLAFILIYAIANLYPSIGMSPVEELRLLSISTTIVFLWLGTLTFYLHNVIQYSRAAFGLAWFFSLILVPAGRHIIRNILSAKRLWGEPTALIGFGESGSALLNALLRKPQIGYRPVVIINGFSRTNFHGVTIPHYFFNGQQPTSRIRDLEGIKTAIVITSEIPEELLHKVIDGQWYKFHHLIMISDHHKGSSVWVEPHDLGGLLGLEIRQNLFNDIEQAFKRAIDVFIVILGLPLALIFFLIISFLIRIDTRGPVIFSQKRIGKNGKEFNIWKFRTMKINADYDLKECLENHPHLRAEWNDKQKLKKDPRVTFVGKFLRRFSLDEWPQIFNILRGEMSLVGPRPIVQEEVPLYGDKYQLYINVKPGLTGLWQVSGRNDLQYEERVNLDEYYVRNWSVWMDIYILSATVGAVITGRGAY